MPLIRSALGNGVDHTTQRAAVLGFESSRLDLHSFNEVDLEVLAHPAILGVSHVHAVDEIDVLGVRGAVNLKTVGSIVASTLQRFHAGAGSEGNQRLER